MRGWVGYALGPVLLLSAVGGCDNRHPIRRAPLRNGAYTWNASIERVDLPVSDLYARAATISYDGDRYLPTLPARFGDLKETRLTLVYNFDAGALSHFEEVEPATTAKVLAAAYRTAKRLAMANGAEVAGLQVDLDCPTRLLPRFGDLLRRLRLEVGRDELSVTGLVTWIGSDRLADALEPLDYWVPQFYEGRLPTEFDADVPVTDHEQIARRSDALRELGVPFRTGVAAYGQALLFRPDGKLQSSYRGLSLEEAFRSDRLRFVSVRRVLGELHYRFRGTVGSGADYGLLYRVPTGDSLTVAWQAGQKGQPDNFAGEVLFRLPSGREATALPVPTLAKILAGGHPEPNLRLTTRRRKNPFAIIEGVGKTSKENLAVTVENVGDAPFIGEEPLSAEVSFREGCAEVVANSDADSVEKVGGESLRSLTEVDFRRWYVAPGDIIELGQVRLGEGCGTAKVELVKR